MTDTEKKLFNYIKSLNLNDVKERQLAVLIDDIMHESYQIGWNDAVDESEFLKRRGMLVPKFTQYVSSDSSQGILDTK